MPSITAPQLRAKYLGFFARHGHVAIPPASLVPANDPSVLFTTAGMHPLAPYLLGEPHPAGRRLVNVQECVRTGDIDVVGDDSHLTWFEMLGNWSLGDYGVRGRHAEAAGRRAARAGERRGWRRARAARGERSRAGRRAW